ncbi:MAG: hypothetical protein WHS46_14125 [Desulfosoma sp.]
MNAAGLPALELLCDLLQKAIELSPRGDNNLKLENESFRRRPDNEEHSLSYADNVKDALVDAVLDALGHIVPSGKATLEEVVNALERRHWKVFQRIALYILREFPDQGKALAAERLTNRELFEDIDVHHEYVLLLRKFFTRLKPEDRDTILGWIDAGPDLEESKQKREEQTDLPLFDDDIAYTRETWKRDRLAWIGPENLPKEWQERYQRLVEEHGEPRHVEFLIGWRGPYIGVPSPKSVEDLKKESVSEIAEFLRTWNPPDTRLGEASRMSLGRELFYAVTEDPGRFAIEANLFRGLDSTYVRFFLSGLEEALKHNKTFEWEPVLDLCTRVISQPWDAPCRRAERMDIAPIWGRTRKAIAYLLMEGFGDCPGSIPIRLREKVWNTLKSLTDNPDPTQKRQRRCCIDCNMDLARPAIDTTWGAFMHAVMCYAFWVRRHRSKEENVVDQARGGLNEMPEVREVLDFYLDAVHESFLAVHKLYGQLFPYLVLLDSEWARERAARIFPIGETEEALFSAAWNSYLTKTSWVPCDEVLDILREQYRHAVQKIGYHEDDTQRPPDPDERLAEHLMKFYRSGKLSLEDPLFTGFWEKATDKLRGHAIAFIGSALRRTKEEIPEDMLHRLKKLWEIRLAQAKQSQSRAHILKEMAAFGRWFISGKFDDHWAVTQLLESLKLGGRTDSVDVVLVHLARTAESYPLESVLCLKMIAEWDRNRKVGGELHASRDRIRKILEVALRHPNVTKEVEQIIQYLCSYGFLELRELLPVNAVDMNEAS